jgi:polar amino acid transport system substrate-binding protein
MAKLELGTAGTLRVAIALSTAGGAFWSFPGADGGPPRGVAVDLAGLLARHLEQQLVLLEYPNSNAITLAAGRGEWDATFIPYDADRAASMTFGPVYNRSESTFLLRAGLEGASVEDIDRSGVRILAVTKTTTGRALANWVKQAQVVEVPSMDEIIRMIGAGEADAFAMSRDSLERLSKDIPGSRVTKGRFFAASTAFAVPHGRPGLLAAGTGFMAAAMRDGTLRRVLDANGMAEAEVPAD